MCVVSYNWHCPTKKKKKWSNCDVTIIREKGLLCGRAKNFELNDLMIKSGLLALDILVILIHKNNLYAHIYFFSGIKIPLI